jgi:hypothetical protein
MELAPRMIGRLRVAAGRRFPLLGEMLVLGAVIGAWEVLRMPLQGSLAVSLAHARDWLALEHTLHLDLEAAVIRVVHRENAYDLLHWGYLNFHLPMLFAFMALARQLRPERYPLLRTAFVVSHIPALIVIGVYPLAPPRWVASMPFSVPAPEGLNGGMHNATAAAASQHVGYPLFIAAATVWLARGSRLARFAPLAFAYPAVVFLIVVGTGNHYTLDAIVGGLCIAFGFAVSRLLHGPLVERRLELVPPFAPALLAAAGYAFVVRALDRASDLTVPPAPLTATDVLLVVGLAAVLAAWRWTLAEARLDERATFEGSSA